MRTVMTAVVLAVALSPSPALAQVWCSPPGPSQPLQTVVTTVDLPDDGVLTCPSGMSVPVGAVLKFNRNASNTGVTLRVTGNVTLAGTIDVSGTNGGGGGPGTAIRNNGLGGPGGFHGGAGANGLVSTTGGTGLGPGGGGAGVGAGGSAGGGGFLGPGAAGTGGAPPGPGGPAYGTPNLLPMVGGSGGGGGGTDSFGVTGGGGGGGGGTLIINATGTINLAISAFDGRIFARGGNG